MKRRTETDFRAVIDLMEQKDITIGDLIEFGVADLAIKQSRETGDPRQLLGRGSSTAGRSAYSTDSERIRVFITFLRNCGGFEIN